MTSLTRMSAAFSKWTAEILGHPALMITLVLGPFLVLLAFGQGVEVNGPRPRTLIVEPAESAGPIQPLPEELNDHIKVVGQTRDVAWAREQLRQGKVDAVAVIPPDPMTAIENGERVPIQIAINEIDPVNRGWANAYLNDQVAELNQRTIAKAITEAQGSLGDIQKGVDQARPLLDALRNGQGDLQLARTQLQQIEALLDPITVAVNNANTALRGASFVIPGLSRTSDQSEKLQRSLDDLRSNVQRINQTLGSGSGSLPTPQEIEDIDRQLQGLNETAATVQDIPPEVLSAPFKLDLDNVAPTAPTFTAFYSPAVLALLLQHLAITLGALSMARVRSLNLMDLLRVAPVRASELVAGNYLSYGLICAFASAVLVGLTALLLNVPVLGSYAALAGGLALLVACSLGLGFIVAMLSRSEQQAAQVAMLVLLASVFFSGFIFGIDRISWPARVISFALPSTYAIRIFQDVMLRGLVRHPSDFAVLGVAAVVLFVASVGLFRRELGRA